MFSCYTSFKLRERKGERTGRTGVLDGTAEVEVVVLAAAAAAETVDDDGPAPCPVAVAVAVGPATRATGAGVTGAFSFCARFDVLPKPRSLPIIPPPGVPGVASPFPLVALAPEPLSSGVVEAGAEAGVAPAPPLDTEGRRVGAAESSFCVALVVAAGAVVSASACAR